MIGDRYDGPAFPTEPNTQRPNFTIRSEVGADRVEVDVRKWCITLTAVLSAEEARDVARQLVDHAGYARPAVQPEERGKGS